MTAAEEKLDEAGTMSFLQHLEELRNTIIKSMGAIVVGMMLMMPLTPVFMKLVTWPVSQAGLDPSTFLVNMKTIGNINVFIMVAFWGGMLLATPLVLYFIGCFIFPGLLPKEKRAVRIGSAAGAVLFFGGAALGFFYALPYFLRINMSIGEWMGGFVTDEVFIQDFAKTALKTVLAFGLSFEMPMLVFMLGYLGIVDSGQLRNKRKHVLVGILVAAMFLTPPDVITQVILTGPLYAMYEFTIWLIWMKEKREGTTELGPPITAKNIPIFALFAALGIGVVFAGNKYMKGPDKSAAEEIAAPTNFLATQQGKELLGEQNDLRLQIGGLSNVVSQLTQRVETNQSKVNDLSTEALPRIQSLLAELQQEIEALADRIPEPPPEPEPPAPAGDTP